MKKANLKSGMKVVTRCGDEFYVLIETETLHFEGGTIFARTSGYDYNLIWKHNSSLDVMRVYQGNKLIWQRQEVELTGDEKNILRNIDKEYNYIARDEYGDYMSVFGSIPFFEDGQWKVDGLGVQTDFPYANIFKNITLQNSPLKISDLLEGE